MGTNDSTRAGNCNSERINIAGAPV